MKRHLPVILLGFVSFFVFLIALMPASIAYHFGKDSMPDLVLQNPEGTVWTGQANQLHTLNQTFNKVSWQLQPLALLLGKISLDIKSEDKQYPLTGNISRSMGGDLNGKDLKGRLPANIVQHIRPISFIGLDGTIKLDIKDFAMDSEQITTAEGEILLDQTRLTQPIETDLGTIKLTLSNENDDVVFAIKDQEAPVGIDGSFRLKPDHKYTFDALFKPTARADSVFVSVLKNAAKPQADGSLRVKHEGVY